MQSYIQASMFMVKTLLLTGGIAIETAMQLWLNSLPHKSAILDSKYTYTGVGISGGKVVVQWFCAAR